MESIVISRKNGNLAEIFMQWLILAVFAIAALLLPASRAGAQSTGPLPAATPSDQPPPSPRASLPAQIGGKPNLSGAWALNKDKSDDPREVMQQAGNASGSRVRVGGGVGPVGGGGGWGRPGGQGGGQGGGRRSEQGGAGGMNDFSRITIEQSSSSAKVTGDSGRVLALYSADDSSRANSSSGSSSGASGNSSSASSGASAANGSGDSNGDSEAASAPPAAQWQGTQLVAVTQGRREGSSTTRTYELSPDGRQLFVTTKMINPRFKGPVTYRLVYDPAPSGG
jgi:hypothetical protein